MANPAAATTADINTACATCGRPLGQHANVHAYDVDGRIVGNATCAATLHARLHPAIPVPTKDCCGEAVGQPCDCAAANFIRLSAYRAPVLVIDTRTT